MEPNFSAMLAGSVVFAVLILGYVCWRFGAAAMLAFAVVSGGFTAVMDFISSFVVHNYVYPGQSQLWVFAYIFWGWIGTCGSCLFLAEGILVRRGEDMLALPRHWWQVPLLAAVISLVLDLFVDPIAVRAGYWTWLVPGRVYFGIPLLNIVGWFVLMLLAPLAWIQVVRRPRAGWKKVALAIGTLVPLMVVAGLLSTAINGALAVAGLQ